MFDFLEFEGIIEGYEIKIEICEEIKSFVGCFEIKNTKGEQILWINTGISFKTTFELGLEISDYIERDAEGYERGIALMMKEVNRLIKEVAF